MKFTIMICHVSLTCSNVCGLSHLVSHCPFCLTVILHIPERGTYGYFFTSIFARTKKKIKV